MGPDGVLVAKPKAAAKKGGFGKLATFATGGRSALSFRCASAAGSGRLVEHREGGCGCAAALQTVGSVPGLCIQTVL